ncbi:MAG: ABC transporter permease, partial [Dysgonamonadaceae bacterium]|nr:ABC transporter permease [Dysgonamonadaceae bacterium]
TPGIEAATQLFFDGSVELIHQTEHFQQLKILYTDPEFFKVFRMKFWEGTPEKAIEANNTIVITRKYAEIIFGNAANAMGKIVDISGKEYTVSAIIEELPSNTHFAFDLLVNMSGSFIATQTSLEFLTYFLIKDQVSMEDTRAAIEKNYTEVLTPFASRFSKNSYGITEKLADIYLHSDATYGSLKKNSMVFIRSLLIISLFILALAVINFINLFTAQCESRMLEIGIRKTNGASIGDIVRQFFREVSSIVLIAFAAGLFLAYLITPYFSQLINKDMDLKQFLYLPFILCLLLLFIITVLLSASYTAFYLSRFSPLDIIGKHLKFSKRRLTTLLIVSQSVITIVLLSYIFVISRQIHYLKQLPKNYSTQNVMSTYINPSMQKNYDAIVQELQNTFGIQKVSGTDHTIGGSCSGQFIDLIENPEIDRGINEYRVLPGLCELMEFQLVEGEFFKKNDPDNRCVVILNEAAVRMLNLRSPVAGKEIAYKEEPAKIVGVVKDFIYATPSETIEPLVLTTIMARPSHIYIRFDNPVSRIQAEQLAHNVFRKFDSEFILEPRWSEDMYDRKFDSFNTQFQVILIGSLLSVFVSMIGLLATHLYTAKRRTKETGIRRIHGATLGDIFALLSINIIQWVLIAGVIAAPIAWYVASGWLNNYANHISLNGMIFVVSALIQCLIAFVTTLGVTLTVVLQNPVKALKTE